MTSSRARGRLINCDHRALELTVFAALMAAVFFGLPALAAALLG